MNKFAAACGWVMLCAASLTTTLLTCGLSVMPVSSQASRQGTLASREPSTAIKAIVVNSANGELYAGDKSCTLPEAIFNG